MNDYVADARRDKLFSQFRPARALLALKSEHPLTGVEREVNDQLTRERPTETVNSAWVPWQCCPLARAVRMEGTRADSVSPASSGGELVAENLHPIVAALYHNTLAIRNGATVIPGCTGDYAVPSVPGTATAYWLGSESAQVTTSAQTFSAPAGTPKGVGAYTEYSRQLALQSSPSHVADVIAADLFRTVGVAIDLAALSGSGESGVPLGILNTVGITTFSGTTFGLTAAMGAVGDIGDALDDSAAWAADRASAITLRQRVEFANTNSPLWAGSVFSGSVAGFPARSTKSLAAGTAIFGAWRYLHIPVWGPGLELSVNPYAAGNFQSGVIGARVLAYIDSIAVYPAAFAATSTLS